MVERVDAVVIGGGLGGLAAAVTLAGQGRRTVVLEQHTEPGGYASGFQRGPYRFDSALHALNGLAPGGGADEVFKGLGIWDRLDLHRLDPLYVLRGGGHEIVAHADPFRYEAELIRAFPDQADGIRSYLDEITAAYHESRRLGVDAEMGRARGLEDFAAHYPALVRLSGETWGETMRRHVTDPRARGALGALWGYFGLPPSRCAALVGAIGSAAYLEHGGWYPEGGSQAISRALVQVLRERGGDIAYGRMVERIDLDGHRATAVTTTDGQRLEADVFVSNASAPGTVLGLLGRERVPGEYADQVARPASSYTTFAVYLGLVRDVFADQGLSHELFLDEDLDPDAAWEAAQRGDWQHGSLAITNYTSVDPGCSPPGHGVAVLTAVAPWDHEDTWGTGGDLSDYQRNPRYLRLKEEAADALVARAAAAVPGLAESIAHREASTPLTNFRYTRNPGGAIEGYENTPANTGLGWLRHETPVENLFLAGAWTGGGGMSPALESGRTAAMKAARAVAARRAA